jgi:hypothetical protein
VVLEGVPESRSGILPAEAALERRAGVVRNACENIETPNMIGMVKRDPVLTKPA